MKISLEHAKAAEMEAGSVEKPQTSLNTEVAHRRSIPIRIRCVPQNRVNRTPAESSGGQTALLKLTMPA